MFKAKVYKLGKSGRLAIMLTKEQVFETGEYDVEVMKPLDAPVNPEAASTPDGWVNRNPV